MNNHEKLHRIELIILGKGKVVITDVINTTITRSGETSVVRLFKRDENGRMSYLDYPDVVEYNAYEQ